ncbi:Xaa-Pro dipeptidase PepQ [Nocardioides endophyticus]|uniref:Xaa-Pro dipeptidase PepQ n=2 Tax=Nocardioides endophyticus TaxID=1353775 RepID=A0ABP8YFZ8_9ACTN
MSTMPEHDHVVPPLNYSDKLHFGPHTNDTHEGIDTNRMREARAERMRSVMRANNIPAVLVTGAENVRYLTGFFWSEFQLQAGYALFFADHPAVVYAPAGSYHQMPDQAPWISQWRIARSWLEGPTPISAAEAESKLFADEIAAELRERGLEREPLAVSEFGARAIGALQAVGIDTIDGLPLMMESARIKTPDEINCLKMIASISSSGFHRALEVLRPGILQSTVAKEVKRAVEDAGSEFGASKVMAGPLAFERGISSSDRRIEWGDLAYVLTCGSSYLGYTACLYRQYVVGRRATGEEAGWYDTLRDRLDSVIGELQPGASTADAAKHFAPASKWGYADEAELLTIEFGHGIGLVNAGSRFVHYNPPIINRQWSFEHPEEIQPGMVIAVEGIEGQHRQSGVRLETMVVITENGPEALDFYPRHEILAAGVI